MAKYSVALCSHKTGEFERNVTVEARQVESVDGFVRFMNDQVLVSSYPSHRIMGIETKNESL